jgi:hypothetical protein
MVQFCWEMPEVLGLSSVMSKRSRSRMATGITWAGLLPALRAIASGDSSRRVVCHVNPGMFVERGARLSTGAVALFQIVPSPIEIEACGVQVISNGEARLLLEDFFYLSGEIPRVSSFEKGRGDHLCRDCASDSWRPDPLMMDERYVAVHVRTKSEPQGPPAIPYRDPIPPQDGLAAR